MSKVYSTSFIRSHGGGPDSYTVPVDQVAVIRCITVTNNNALDLPEQAQVYLGHSSCSLLNTEISPLLPSSGTTYLIVDARVVVEATDVIWANGGPDVDITVSGYLLSLP